MSNRRITHIVLHCTAGPQTQQTQSILNYWRNVLKWRSVGYHYIVNVDGSFEQLSPIDKPTNGVAGHNANSIHICYKGGQNGKDTRTVAQKATLVNLVKHMKTLYPNAVVCGHRDFSPDKNGDGKITSIDWVKICPCFDAKIEYSNL